MRRYFSYPFDDTVKARLLAYYNSQDSANTAEDMHGANHRLKTELKLGRLKNQLVISPDDVALDVGCSQGALCQALAPKLMTMVGMDISDALIKQNIANNQYANIEYQSYNGIDIGCKERYDKVFMMDVLEHAFEPDALMESVFSALKPGGLLYLQVPTTGWLSEAIFGKYHMGHLRYYDDAYLRAYFPRFGFTILSTTVYNSVPLSSRLLKHPKAYRVADKLLGVLPPQMYPYFGSVMTVCQKPRGKDAV